MYKKSLKRKKSYKRKLTYKRRTSPIRKSKLNRSRPKSNKGKKSRKNKSFRKNLKSFQTIRYISGSGTGCSLKSYQSCISSRPLNKGGDNCVFDLKKQICQTV
jgi:hypothetical protein